MAAIPEVPTDTTVDALLTEIMPDAAQKMLAEDNVSDELGGTEIKMVVQADDDSYSYIVKDGAKVEFQKGSVENPMILIKISKDDISKMIKSGNLDMLLGIQNDLNKAKYNAISSLKGSFTAEIADENATYTIEAILNNATDPHSVFKMSAADTSSLMKRETNPVNLFMSGAMKIEGDMAFAMATQPLFS